MGRFSKFVKKFTKPISKVLDKVVPNELKPLLPYAAAFAPYMLPAGFAGGSGLSSLFRRGLLTGSLNLGSQLAQEGSEGDFNPLSVGLGALQGAMTAPGAASTMRGAMNPGEAVKIAGGNMPGQSMGGFNYDTSGLSGLDKTKNFMLKGGAKLADLAGGAQKTLSDPFAADVSLKELATAGAVPFSGATGDLAYAQANKAMKDYNRDEALLAVEQAASQAGADQSMIDAVKSSMGAYNYTQEEIDNILSQFFSEGGRVGYGMGGDVMEGIMGMFNKGEKEPNFNTMAETVETVEMKPKEYLFDNKLKFEVGPGQNEQEAVLNALFADEEGLIPEDRKQEYYNLYINNLYRSGDMNRSDYDGYIEEGILTKPQYNMGGRVELNQGGILGRMGILGNSGQGAGTGIQTGYETLPEMQQTGLGNNNMPVFPRLDKLTKGVSQAENSLQNVNTRLGQAPAIQNLFAQTNSQIGLGGGGQESYSGMGYGRNNTLPLQQLGITGYNMGGSVLPQGMEMDYRGGGFIPMGSAERADDVDARVSKNEFVMTADAVRAAGGGSVNQGAKRMYELMNNLEARA